MFGKLFDKIFAGFFLLLCVSCADPRYAPAVSHLPPTGTIDKLKSCEIKMNSGECISSAWEKMPTEDDYGSFIFKTFHLSPADNSVVEDDLSGNFTVLLWMPAMGHGSSPVTVERIDVGTYRASRVFFSMKGQWEIRFQLKEGNAVTDQAIIPINW